jgi:cytidine deaminase
MAHTPLQKKLYEKARQAMTRAYNPYSNYGVGAALHTTTGKIFVGCNVENVSYGLTLCGERNAITSMIAECGRVTIDELLIVVSGDTFPSPCGSCRQVMAEFSIPETTIHLARPKENSTEFEMRSYRMAALLPLNFTQQILWAPKTESRPAADPGAQEVVIDTYNDKQSAPEHETAYADEQSG